MLNPYVAKFFTIFSYIGYFIIGKYLYNFIKKIDLRKYNISLIIIMIICLFTGLITPLGDTAYTYLIKTMQGTTTENINEHFSKQGGNCLC